MNSVSEDDKSQIQTSKFAKAFMEREEIARYFDTQQTKIKFAVSVALKHNLKPADRDSTFKNAHHIADLDNLGQLRALVRTKYPNDPPGKMIEGLAESGFQFIDMQMRDNGWTLEEFLL
jgi:hypothetical protein